MPGSWDVISNFSKYLILYPTSVIPGLFLIPHPQVIIDRLGIGYVHRHAGFCLIVIGVGGFIRSYPN